MALRQTIQLIVLALSLVQCSISRNNLAGAYLNSYYGDTLLVHKDSSYELLEKLNNGRWGWSSGKWMVDKNTIRFERKPRALVRYDLQVVSDTMEPEFQVRLLLSDTKRAVEAESVTIYKNGQPMGKDLLFVSGNIIRPRTRSFDSITVQTKLFRRLKIRNEFNGNHGYIVKVYPQERLYELDKVSFKLKDENLQSVSKTFHDNIILTFKKLR